jgi:hypothetical protein
MLHLESALPRDKRFGAYLGGVVNWRTRLVHVAARIAGLCVKVEGFPLGSTRNIDREASAASEASARIQ